jgi:hypothetical protein
MGALQDVLAYIDNLKRVAKRNLSDAVNNPKDTAELIRARQQEQWAKPDAGVDLLGGPLGKVGGALAGIFAGKGAKTADLVKQALAERMLKAGEPPAKVWRETGWGVGPDGKWRFEIPDNLAEYRPGRAYAGRHDSVVSQIDEISHAKALRTIMDTEGVGIGEAKAVFRNEFGREPIATAGQIAKVMGAGELQTHLDVLSDRLPRRDNWTGRQGEVLQHDQLYSAYPEMQYLEFSVKPDTRMGKAGAVFDGGVRIGVDSAYGLQTGKSLNTHELQHGVQLEEGFAPGTTPQMARSLDDNPYPEELRPLVDEYRELWRSLKGQSRPKSPVGLFSRKTDLDDWYDSVENVSDPAVREKLNSVLERLDYERQNLFGVDEGILAQLRDHEAYRKYAGEAEARLAQHRIPLTAEQRADQYPWEPDYFEGATGTALSDLIFK